MTEYRTIEVVPMPSRNGQLPIVELPAEVSDLGTLKGAAIIDGKAVIVRSIEAFMHNKPWRKGERVGLLVSAASRPSR